MRLIRDNVERVATNAVDIAKLESEGFVPVAGSSAVNEAPIDNEAAIVSDFIHETERKKPGRKKSEV